MADGRLIPDAGEQKAVALIRTLRGSGHSLRAIASELDAQGYRTKTGRPQWHHKSVAAIIGRESLAA